jgi:hypothetical protein
MYPALCAILTAVRTCIYGKLASAALPDRFAGLPIGQEEAANARLSAETVAVEDIAIENIDFEMERVCNARKKHRALLK